MKKNPPKARPVSKALVRTIRFLADQTPARPHPLELAGQPFDRLLLNLSPLYRRSRELFLRFDGTFEPHLHSSPRSLASLSLVSRHIEYSPVEREMVWTATDQIESSTRPERLLDLRTWVTGVFHEQNHRILWRVLPPAPKRAGEALRRYLHFAESLVVMLDMKLADGIPAEISHALYQAGSIYDPGTESRRELERLFKDTKKVERYHWNALQAACEATFLNLELFSPAEIAPHVEMLFPLESAPRPRRGPSLIRRSAERALRLDRLFVESTNPQWLRKHGSKASELLARTQTSRSPLNIPQEMDLGRGTEGYFSRNLLSERVLEHFCSS